MYSQAYINFLVHFHGDRDYFECHEILEEYWKENSNGEKDSIWVGLILMAVSNYHHRRGNFSGAYRTLEKSLGILKKEESRLSRLGLNSSQMLKILSERLDIIQSRLPYFSYNLPVNDQALLNACLKECSEKGFNWGNSNAADQFLINRHKLRDRTLVIIDRETALEKKRKKGSE